MANRKFIVGNWKMNGLRSALGDIGGIAKIAEQNSGVDVAICPPATLIASAAAEFPDVAIGAQDCHQASSGAHTGCLSSDMIKEAGASLSILGHSERRADQHETDADVKAKAEAVRSAGLGAIICVGETEEERDAGSAVSVVCGQLSGSFPEGADGDWLTIAYEPVWAIGTGRVPEASDVEEMHAAIRSKLGELMADGSENVRILYGGSMNGGNAAELLAVPNVDGGLVGGASLSAEKFGPIIEAAAAF
ncbi:triosephosphate isomerase [Parasphingorhabdus marina DSM 22363]|uniref:Triosephosphate isomerase n=1 Tax=Parasphingorhabdus marina DSM 22363 TaxID=1123272 RepID=A0A1N6FYX4_9SPHN|nr:triose-phosphate isomerase [Parasphingorhabdus marina]SIO00401.1 triosephosphate isomerase [Parasphingorhabdus marina DSM 22363]